jgi:hypothetical protein
MQSPKFICNDNNKIVFPLNEDWVPEKIERVEENDSDDTLELTRILSTFSEDRSIKDSSSEVEILNILRRNEQRVLSKSNPEIYNKNILKPKCKRFVPERVSNPFHKNPFGGIA